MAPEIIDVTIYSGMGITFLTAVQLFFRTSAFLKTCKSC